jgi:hypothetical protein
MNIYDTKSISIDTPLNISISALNIVDVDISSINIWSNLIGFDFLLNLYALYFGMDGVLL